MANEISFRETVNSFIFEDGEHLNKNEYYHDPKSGYILLNGIKVIHYIKTHLLDQK